MKNEEEFQEVFQNLIKLYKFIKEEGEKLSNDIEKIKKLMPNSINSDIVPKSILTAYAKDNYYKCKNNIHIKLFNTSEI